MPSQRKRGQSELSRWRSRDNEAGPTAGSELKWALSDDEHQCLFDANPLKGLRALDQYRRLAIIDRIYRGAKGQLDEHEVLDEYEDMMEAIAGAILDGRRIKKLVPYVNRAAKYRGVDLLKRKCRREGMVKNDNQLVEGAADRVPARNYEVIARVRNYLESLKGEENRVLAQRLLMEEPLSIDVTAYVLGVSPATVKRRLQRIKEDLKNHLMYCESLDDGGHELSHFS